MSCRLGEERLERPVPPPTIQGPPSPGTGFDTPCPIDAPPCRKKPCPPCSVVPVPVTYGDFIEFNYEGSPQGGCETMYFSLRETGGYTNVEYFYSLVGLGTDVPGSNADLNSNVVPALYQGNQNFIFVGKAEVTLPGGTTKILATKCLLDCVAGGPAPGRGDPERCESSIL